MPYQVLARKYRPQRFSDVVGQDHVTRTLLNALAQGRIAHGYIFSGHRGIGKTTIARILAMALNCSTPVGSAERPTQEPCLACVNCREISSASRQESSVFEESHSIDVEEIDAATNRGIDDARLLTSKIQARPTNKSKYRIIILDEAHQITDAAWNALLKTLEEPPEWAVFMFATTQAEDIPQTIRSRCQHFTFHAVKFEAIVQQLRAIAGRESIGASDETLALLAEAGDGSMRDALSIMDQAIASSQVVDGRAELDAAQIRELMGTVPNAVFERLLESISENQAAPVIEEVNRLLNAGNSASQLARQFTRYLRNTLMARLAGEQTELLQLSPDERARAARSALLFSEEDLTRFLQVMLRTFDELNYRQEPRFHLELGLLKLVHLQRLLPVEQLLSQLGGTNAAARGAHASGSSAAGGGPLPNRSAPAIETLSANTPGADTSRPTAASLPLRAAAVEAPTLAAVPPPEPDRPAFSPFEQDSRRKTYESAPGLKQGPPPTPSAVPLQPGPEAAKIAAPRPGVEPGVAPPAAASSVFRPEVPAAAASSPAAAQLEQEPAPVELPGSGEPTLVAAASRMAGAEAAALAQAPAKGASDLRADLASLRLRICDALDQAGHNTAAALLANAIWSETETGAGGAIRVEVSAKKTMLGLTMNAEADKICRETMRAALGHPRPITFIPGEGGRAADSGSRTLAPERPALAGSAQARAMDNPLVKQAQELFRAEVRSVLDLRKS